MLTNPSNIVISIELIFQRYYRNVSARSLTRSSSLTLSRWKAKICNLEAYRIITHGEKMKTSRINETN